MLDFNAILAYLKANWQQLLLAAIAGYLGGGSAVGGTSSLLGYLSGLLGGK
jgi:hypothetical protein